MMSNIEPTPQLDAHQETMVSDFLRGELDRQTGKAEARFREFLNSDQREEKPRLSPADSAKRRVVSKPRRRRDGGMPGLRRGRMESTRHKRTSNVPVQNPQSVSLPWVQQSEDQRTYDGGTYVDENGDPMRILQRRKWQTTRWFDEQKQLKAQSVVPEDETVYVKMKTY